MTLTAGTDTLDAADYVETAENEDVPYAVGNPSQWNMAAKNSTSTDEVHIATAGHINNVDKDLTENKTFGQIKWYVTPNVGEAPVTSYTAETAAAALVSGEADQIAALQSAYYAGQLDPAVLSSLVSTEFTLPGTSITAVVVDTETYDIYDGDEDETNNVKAMLTWQTKDCVTWCRMNTTTTNAGGWDASDMRKYLNGYDTYASSGSYIGTLPSDVANSLKMVNVVTADNGNSTTAKTSADKLFLPAGKEVFGSATSYVDATAESSLSQWAYYADGGSKVKNYNGSTNYWWERSPNGSSATIFCSVFTDGTASYNSASDNGGVAPSGCL